MTHDVDDDQNDAMECAADKVRVRVDGVGTDTLLRIDANPQHKMRGHDARERGRRGNHECDDYLKPHRLLNVCATEDDANYHTRNCSGSHKAVQRDDGQRVSIGWDETCDDKPHTIDGRLKASAEPFNCEKMRVAKVLRA